DGVAGPSVARTRPAPEPRRVRGRERRTAAPRRRRPRRAAMTDPFVATRMIRWSGLSSVGTAPVPLDLDFHRDVWNARDSIRRAARVRVLLDRRPVPRRRALLLRRRGFPVGAPHP